MIYIQDKEKFVNALKFSRTLPKESRKSLRQCFNKLNRIKRNYDCKLVLINDFVEHSFLFGFTDKVTNERRCFNGGLILHGFQNTLSVEITSKNFPHWSIHT